MQEVRSEFFKAIYASDELYLMLTSGTAMMECCFGSSFPTTQYAAACHLSIYIIHVVLKSPRI
jgi:hypothetical protein